MAEGLKLTVTGMTTVFLFLAFLVCLINLSASLVRRFLPEPVNPPSPNGVTVDDHRERRARVAVALAIIHQHRALQTQR